VGSAIAQFWSDDAMECVTLGRTGLRASVMGLGCGGHSRVGLSTHKDEGESVRVVRAALDCGVNLIDTAEGYGTEPVVGKALQGIPRTSVILSTKKTTVRGDRRATGADVVAGLEASLSRLGTDYVDIYPLHAVRPDMYAYARAELVPAMLNLRDQGKIRFLGITEIFEGDPQHTMLQTALRDDCWEVIMVGFNLLNQGARRTVFPLALQRDVGTLIMFAVRRALSRPERLREVIAGLKQRGRVDADLDEHHGLEFLLHPGGAASIQDAAYRFCRHEPGAHVVLSGTGNVSHLHANVKSLNSPPLPAEDTARLCDLFGKVDDISGN
jgi:L-galactose dehydrogenase